jgi:predicted alpha-1,2-mannosidase
MRVNVSAASRIMKPLCHFPAFVVFIPVLLAASPLAEVDPFLGVDNDGNTVPGAKVPFGFANPSPDTLRDVTSGYISSEPIIGFSQTHVSGTGGGGKYGNFRITPQVGALELHDLASPKADEVASPGYYAVRLTRPDVKVDLTATRLTAVHRYTFPADKQARLLLDGASFTNNASRGRQIPFDCTILIGPPDRAEGTVNFMSGWNPSNYTLHFAASFSRPFTAHGTWSGKRVQPGQTLANAGREPVGTWFEFDTSADPVVEVRVAVSFISPAKARQNLDEETGGKSFDEIHKLAESAWTAALDKIQVEGGSAEERAIFHSSLYRSHYMPHDLTGENAWWESDEPHYEDFYCLWDTFRCLHPLLTLIQPERQRDMVRSLIDTYRHTGWMPDARIAGANGMTQGGSNSDVVIADALLKGLTGIDYETAFEAMLKNGEVDSSRPLFEGREVSRYIQRGYMALDQTRSASRTMEYAYNDFCIALVAEKLGRKEVAERYFNRSRNWRNLWDDQTRTVRPRHPDGRWMEDYSPTTEYSLVPERFAWWAAPYYEGTGYQFSTYVPHEPEALIAKLGGREPFLDWLDVFFRIKPAPDGYDPKGLYTHVNEPDLLATYLYLHAGKPERTQRIVRDILAKQYRHARGGLPGNDDAGTMSAWYVWNSIGLYPNVGQPYYYLVSPVFRSARIDLGGGKSFTIEAPATSPINACIRSATLNGKPLDRSWITHEELSAGGKLVMDLAAEPTTWGAEKSPPSFFPR